MKITDALLGENAIFYTQFDFLEQAIPAANSVAQVKSLGAMRPPRLPPRPREGSGNSSESYPRRSHYYPLSG